MDPRLARQPVRIKVYLSGRCTACNRYGEELIHDYGRLSYKETEDKMDEVNHQIHPITCRCGQSFLPQDLVYRDELKVNDEVFRLPIDHGSLLMPESSASWHEGHDKRHEFFAEQADVFYAAFIDHALEDWRASVNELQRQEIADAYNAMGIDTDLRTDGHARRDVLNRFTTAEEKGSFWRLANRYFIDEELLHIGAVGWVPKDYVKLYGLRRTQFALLHFPIAEVHEPERTKALAQIFRRDKGDNAFLLRRITALSDQLDVTKRKLADSVLAQDRLKAEAAADQRKLAEAYERIRQLEFAKPVSAVSRSEEDRRKLRDQKGLITELLAEVKLLRGLVPEDPVEDRMEESESADSEPIGIVLSYDHLAGKTVVIVGGSRAEHTINNDYPCEIVSVDFEAPEIDLQAALCKADYIAVLTRHVSHAAMWDAKAYAVETGTPIIYTSAINIRRIVDLIADKWGDEK